MERIKLSPREKEIIVALAKNTYILDTGSKDANELEHLEYLGLGKGLPCEFGGYITFKLTPKAKAYLFENPKLKDPSILEDKKFWIDFIANLL